MPRTLSKLLEGTLLVNEVVITNNSYKELPGGAQSRLKMFFSITVTAVSKYVMLSPGKI